MDAKEFNKRYDVGTACYVNGVRTFTISEAWDRAGPEVCVRVRGIVEDACVEVDELEMEERKTARRPTPQRIGALVRAARKRAGRTQAQLADFLGTSRPTVVAMEKGDRPIRDGELVRVAAFLQVPVGELRVPLSFTALLRSAVDRGIATPGDVALMVLDGDLSEGQAASVLKMSRIDVRGLVLQVDEEEML